MTALPSADAASAISEANAKKRFKILFREKSRLAEKGTNDPEVDRELAKLAALYPASLGANIGGATSAGAADGTLQPTTVAPPSIVKPLSAQTAAMLAFAEAMSTQQPVAAAAAASATNNPNESKSNSGANPSTHEAAAAAPSGPSPTSPPRPEPVAPQRTDGRQEAPPSSQQVEATSTTADRGDAGLAKIVWSLAAINTALRFWIDVNARPRGGAVAVVVAMVLSAACAVYHSLFLTVATCDTAEWEAAATQPLMWVLLVQAHVTLVMPLLRGELLGGGSRPPSLAAAVASVARFVAIAAARDVAPALCLMFVAYHATWIACGLLWLEIPRHFC